LNTLGIKGSISKDLQSFCDYINSNIVTSEFTDEIAKTIVDVKYDKKVRKEFMLYEIRMKDLRNEALAEGMAQGIAQGMAKGMAKEKVNVAKNLLHMGLGTAQIATATGLSAAEVERIQAELEAAKA
jgi:predicted transposase/invertase (TIGR01784 family)